MKKIYFLSLVLLMSTKSFATHNISGEISFIHISGLTYQVQITTYTKASAPADRPYMSIFYGDGTSDSIPRVNGGGLGVIVAPDVKQNIYTGTHTYLGSGTFLIHFEDPNRNGGIVNIPGSVNVPFYTEAQLVINGALGNNNSVQFLQMPIINCIIGLPFTHNVTCYDPDGDCLTFEMVSCKGAGGLPIPGYYLPNFVNLDSVNGEITWTNPSLIGPYSFAVKVNEWRNGYLIGFVIRDFQIIVAASPAVQYSFSGNSTWQIDANGNYSYTLYAGDSIHLNLSYTDPSTVLIDLNAYGDVFLSSNPAVFLKTISLPAINSVFSWTPDSTNVRSAPYLVTFRGTSDNSENDISLMIFVLDANTLPCSMTTSVNETNPSANGIHIFPNPFSGNFSISGLEPGINHLLLYDPRGRLVKNIVLKDYINQIDVSEISDGFFIFELRNGKTVLIKGKLVKE